MSSPMGPAGRPDLTLIATDYDGTIAREGTIAPAALAALRRWKGAGRRLALVTGRRFDDLLQVCPELPLFDLVVAENGAVLHWPQGSRTQVLGEAPPKALLDELTARGCAFWVGLSIVALLARDAQAAREALAALRLSWTPHYNQESLMLLPAGIDKASGLRAALAALRLSSAQAVGVGDAENDAPLLAASGLGAAVGDATPQLKQAADWVASRPGPEGFAELVEALLGAAPDMSV